MWEKIDSDTYELWDDEDRYVGTISRGRRQKYSSHGGSLTVDDLTKPCAWHWIQAGRLPVKMPDGMSAIKAKKHASQMIG